MSSIAAVSILKPILIVGALAAVGMGGYNLTTTGCVLRSSDTPEQSTTLVSVSDGEKADSSCGSGPCDSEASETTEVELASFDADASKAEGCSDAMKAACEVMGECPEGMMEHCADAEDCPTGEAKVSLVADQSAAKESTECDSKAKADCDSKGKADYDSKGKAECDSKAKAECEKSIDAEQTADAEQVETETSEG